MKWRNSYAVVAGCAVVGLTAFNAQAQSLFAGFYGQLSTGYESNQLGAYSGSSTEIPNIKTDTQSSRASQTFGGAPLVFGAGYYWQASEKWFIGAGADYSALSQSTSSYSQNINNTNGNTGIASGTTVTTNGSSVQLSNRFNLFITPGYAIDKDKLVYVKAGYSQVSTQYNRATSVTRTANGIATTTPATGGNQTSNQGGYLVGLGYKQIITSGLYGFVEGNYMGYSAPSYSYTSATKPLNTLNGVSSSGTRTSTASFGSLNSFQALIGLGYAF
jgi:hypothetical protein